ncbi:tetratricopeptide repeat protein [Mucilaginibacter antarcticus]|uniref:tetratricopeptide repeat-containing sensor histidine kinase n=1 Tax=Mucilaginibacter antarcticus TaxID=1855725 RepID=UPI003632028E
MADVNTLRGNYTVAITQYNTSLSIYRQLNNLHGISDCYMELGYIQDYLGQYDAALSLYKKALAITIKTRDEKNEAETYNLMGITYDNKGDVSKALDYYFKALFIDVQRKDELSAASKYNNIGLIMQHLELYPKALNYYARARAIWQKHNDQLGLSSVYQNIGETFMAQHYYAKAIPYLRRAAAMFTQQGDSEGTCLIYYDLGMYNYYVNRPDSALHYLNKSLIIAANSKVIINKANAQVGLAMVYNAIKQYNLAYSNATQALAIGQTLNSLNIHTDASLQASLALGGLKHYQQAYNMHLQYSALKSELKHAEGINKIMLYNIEVDFARKQRDHAEQQLKREKVYQTKIASQRNQNIIYAALSVILATVALVYYNAKRKQQRINELLAEKNRSITQHQDVLNTQALKLNELNVLKDRLISVLAHDLRAPISTLRGLFNLLTDDTISPEEFAAMTPKVFIKLEHTSDFLDTLLFWINSQVDNAGKRSTPFELADLVNRELAHLEDQLKQKNISVSINVTPDAIAWADPSCVRIVMHNFLTNAIKFSNRDSSIEIEAHPLDGHYIKFCLTDHGVGMSPDYLNNLFKTQVSSRSGTENESGTGMGMMFCKDLIEQQNGTIWAQSELGKGTKLCFTLPAVDKTSAQA